jgi:glycosyltransferase involved in cell wall biosynthesis
VGLPVYNNPHFLRRALDSLTCQSYENLEIIVSDDCSPGDETGTVVREFAKKDVRIKCFRQERNIGPVPNHKFVFDKATGDFFFWASEDDEWRDNFLEAGVRFLMSNPSYDAWCCTIRNIDSFGRVIREYSGFSRWTSTQNKWKDIIKYLFEPENMGKSHVFHSIFRRKALSDTIERYWVNDTWGTDMCFGLAFLTRYNLVATDEVLFDKRLARQTDIKEHVDPIVINNPSRYIFPLSGSIAYILEYFRAARTTRYKYMVLFVMLLRLPIAIRNDGFSIHDLKIALYTIALKIRPLGLLAGRPFLYLQDLSWKRKFGYRREHMIVDVRWSEVHTIGIIQVPLSVLRASIITSTGVHQLVTIEETPHYGWIRSLVEGREDVGMRDKYREYVDTYYSEEDNVLGMQQVAALVSSFKSRENKESLITIVTYPPTCYKGSEYIVLYDGTHRSAIALALGHEFIQCRLVSKRISGDDFGNRMLDSKTGHTVSSQLA